MEIDSGRPEIFCPKGFEAGLIKHKSIARDVLVE